MARLIVLAGLPASGKSTIARGLAGRLGAVWLRIDSMDQAIWSSPTAPRDLEDWTYRAAQAVAADNLRLGLDVIGDAVNPVGVAREGWDACARRADVPIVWIEIVCSDESEHRRRLETRGVDIPGLPPLDWAAVAGRAYEPFERDRIVIDTFNRAAEQSLDAVFQSLALTGR